MTLAVPTERIDRLIAELDGRIATVVDAVLHHPDFKALEAAWRGLAFVVDRVAFDENVKVDVWDCSKQDLERDLKENADITYTRLFRTVYSAEYGQFGGQPYGAIFASFGVAGSAADVGLLRRLAGVAAMAHAPLFVSAEPALLRLTSFSDLPFMTNLPAVFEEPRMIAWNSLRDSEDSRYIGVLLPRMLLRLPHREASGSTTAFVYDERVQGPNDYLWGSPTFAFAVRLADSFARSRTYTGVLGTFDDDPPVRDFHPALGPSYAKPPVEVVLSRGLEQGLTELGFIPLTCDLHRSTLRFTTASSLQRPKSFGSSEGGEAATLNFLLGSRLPYLLLASRFAHYLKVIERERVGAHRSRAEIERELNEWLTQYVVVMDSASVATRMKYPLRNARVSLRDIDGDAGWYGMDVLIQPHIKYMRQAMVLSVSGRLEAR